MKKYTTSAVVTLPAGTVMELTAEQAAARRHALQTMRGNNLYRATAPVQFKRGEVIGLETEPPKALADELVDEKEAARRARAEKDKAERAMSAQRDQWLAEGATRARAELLARLPEPLRAAVDAALADKPKG